jgi:hypothetical protein
VLTSGSPQLNRLDAVLSVTPASESGFRMTEFRSIAASAERHEPTIRNSMPVIVTFSKPVKLNPQSVMMSDSVSFPLKASVTDPGDVLSVAHATAGAPSAPAATDP